MSEEMKVCPYCGEEILATAKKCKYCKQFLSENPDGDDNSDTKRCPVCGEEILAAAKKCKHCGEWINYTPQTAVVQITGVEQIAEYQKISNIIWLIVAILQICSVVCIIAGIWNIIAVTCSWKLPEKILRQEEDVPSYYEGIVGLIVIAVVNLLLGGIIGVILVGFDFYIRNLVLNNRHLFNKGVESAV